MRLSGGPSSCTAKDVYFAVGCKVLAGGAGIQPITSSDSYLTFVGEQPSST
jgi:hypothetical protein